MSASSKQTFSGEPVSCPVMGDFKAMPVVPVRPSSFSLLSYQLSQFIVDKARLWEPPRTSRIIGPQCCTHGHLQLESHSQWVAWGAVNSFLPPLMAKEYFLMFALFINRNPSDNYEILAVPSLNLSCYCREIQIYSEFELM